MRLNKWMVSSIFLVSLTSCGGGKGESANVDFQLVPQQPIVINAPLANPITGQTMTPPWFKFALSVSNNSSQKLTIVALNILVSGIVGGSVVNNQVALDPSILNYSTAAGTNCVYTAFTTIDPHKTATLDAAGSSSCNTYSPVTFYVSGNPIDNTITNPSFHYSVSIQPLGWFGTNTNPTDRFTRTYYFSTQ